MVNFHVRVQGVKNYEIVWKLLKLNTYLLLFSNPYISYIFSEKRTGGWESWSFLLITNYFAENFEKLKLHKLPILFSIDCRYEPTQADIKVFQALGKVPSETHVLRWYNHIKSLDHKKLPTEKAPVKIGAGGRPEKPAKDDDGDIDLFGSDEEEDAEAAKIREERLKAYAEKKSKKPVLIAKSSIVIDVKPWDDETNMQEMEKLVRSIQMDGLVWGACKWWTILYFE